MTDDKLRERLLAGPIWSDGSPIGAVVGEVNGATMREAVAELDRLEAENARKSAIADQLEGALTLIADDNSWRGFSPMPIIERMRETARQALATYRESGE